MIKVVLIFIGALATYCFLSLELEVVSYLVNTILYDFLTSKALAGLLEGLSLSLMAACVFYVFIDFFPRLKRKKIAENFFRKQASVVLHAYKESKIHAHEMSAKNVPDEFCEQWLKEQISILKNVEYPKKRQLFLQLKCAVDAAYSQKDETRSLLPIAATLSETHAVEWLGLFTKQRLLAEEYGRKTFDPLIYTAYYEDGGELSFEERGGKQSISYLILMNRQLRMLEYCEACLSWYKLISKKDILD